MLMIKQRFPTRKLFIYGGSAFAFGFVSIVTILANTTPLVQRYTSVGYGQIDAQAETIRGSETQSSDTTSTDKTGTGNWQPSVLGASTKTNPTNTNTQSPAVISEQTPVVETTNPETTLPEVPVVISPTEEVTEPIIDLPIIPEATGLVLDLVD